MCNHHTSECTETVKEEYYYISVKHAQLDYYIVNPRLHLDY